MHGRNEEEEEHVERELRAMVLRGRGGSAISRAAGSGVLDPRTLSERQELARRIAAGEVDPPDTAPEHELR